MIKQKLPSISIVIPTFNESKYIARCLASIFKQDYPRELLDIIIVDAYSTDDTVEIAKKYPVRVIYNREKDAQIGKMLALRQSRSDFFTFLDADVELAKRDWIRLMVNPLLKEPEVIASVARIFSRPSDPPLTRYLSYHHLQNDPLYNFFSIDIKETFQENKGDYVICHYSLNKIPPAGWCLYRRERLYSVIGERERLMELDNLVILVKNGYDKFAYVPKAGIYHAHGTNLKQLLKKRLRNIEKNYLPLRGQREFTWFKSSSKKDMIKIVFWIIYAHLLLPATIRGIGKALRNRDFACMYEPLVTLLVTDGIIYGFLKHPEGRAMAIHMAKSLFSLK